MQWLIDIIYEWLIAHFRPKGTSSFLVASSDAAADIIAIADYLCDGTADQVQIQEAIDALPAEGGVVALASGTFYKNNKDPIDLISNMKLLMTPGTTIELTANPGNSPYILRASSKQNIVIEGGILDGKKATQNTITGFAFGIAFFDTRYSVISEVTVRDIGTSDADSGYGIYLNDSTMNRVSKCLLDGAKRENLVCFNGSNNNVVTNNIAINSEDRDFVVHESKRNVFANNVSASAGGRGFEIRTNSSLNTINGNSIFGSTDEGIVCATENNTISNNIIEGCSKSGISISAEHNTITNNHLYYNDAGIKLAAGGDSNIVTGNYLANNGGLGGGEDNGITVFGDDNFISSNGFAKNSDQVYGIRLHASAADNFISNNDLRNSGTSKGLRDDGTDNIIRDNIGIDEILYSGVKTLQLFGATSLHSTGGAITGTLPDGIYIGQTKTIAMTNATNPSTVSVTHHETSDPEIGTFDAVDEVWILSWTGTEWVTIKATCTFL